MSFHVFHNLYTGQFLYFCQISSKFPFKFVFQTVVYSEDGFCSTIWVQVWGREKNEGQALIPLSPFVQGYLEMDLSKENTLFLQVPVIHLLAFLGLGLLVIQGVLALVYYAISCDSLQFNFSIVRGSCPKIFLNYLLLWECHTFLARTLTIINTVHISQNRCGHAT